MKSSSQMVRLHYTFFSCFWFSAVLQQRLANAHLHCPWVHVFVVLVELCGADVSRIFARCCAMAPLFLPSSSRPEYAVRGGVRETWYFKVDETTVFRCLARIFHVILLYSHESGTTLRRLGCFATRKVVCKPHRKLKWFRGHPESKNIAEESQVLLLEELPSAYKINSILRNNLVDGHNMDVPRFGVDSNGLTVVFLVGRVGRKLPSRRVFKVACRTPPARPPAFLRFVHCFTVHISGLPLCPF